VQQLETEHSERTQRGYSIETELRQNRERLNQIAIEVDRGHARRRTNEERCDELTVRTASSEAEMAQANSRLLSLEEERDGHQQVLDSQRPIGRRPAGTRSEPAGKQSTQQPRSLRWNLSRSPLVRRFSRRSAQPPTFAIS